MLLPNLDRNFRHNRAPLSFSFDAGWHHVNKRFTDVLKEFIRESLESKKKINFITEQQVLLLIQQPTKLNSVKDFAQWKEQ